MVILLSRTGDFPGGRTSTLTPACTATVAPEVLMLDFGADVTSISSEIGASISAGF